MGNGRYCYISPSQAVFRCKSSIGSSASRSHAQPSSIYARRRNATSRKRYLDTNNLSKTDAVKREIIELYLDDFRKIDKTGRAAKLFESIPSELNKNSARYQVASVLDDAGRKNLMGVLADMKDSMVVNFAYHANDPNVDFSLHSDEDYYKMFVGDTGLFVTLAFWDKDYTENTIYEKLLSDKLSSDMGYAYENLVAQMLTASGNKLFYYTFPHATSHKNYEIDFLLSRGKKIYPIEVKSSGI